MEQLIPLLVQVIGGAAGGNAVGALLKKADLSAILRTVLGIVGGVGGGQLASLLGILQSVLGQAGTGGEIAGHAGASAIGGALLTAIVGMIKQSANKAAH
ncbi:MAG TPA: hypothetical protein VHK01_02415 [Lacipirellulaceae bacterium]|jgi:hypothetical protein|nr:hypothetical protein [Lacipirellulaceae bacterium]